MTSPRPRLLFAVILAALAAAGTAATACSDLNQLPPPLDSNAVDTISLFALTGTPITEPSAYNISDTARVRTDRSPTFDFAFDIDSTGKAVLLPTGALGLGQASGIRVLTTPFDSIFNAPTGTYVDTMRVVVDSGTIAVIRSRPTVCSFGATVFLYAKLQVLHIDTTSAPGGRRIDFRILADQNCGYRGLKPGLPTS
ncbi:MAG TPA: hypothetical protein VFK78_05045 [Gemmatimonadales bacterium]|nr:hypothetical protein [Gemmatimonadales bacterium]